MLVKMLPDQISAFWDVIKYAIEQSLPPIVGEHPDKMNRILASLLSSEAQCWASYYKEDETAKFEGIVITRILYDDVSGTRNLLIYCLYGYSDVDKKSWLKGLETILKYAKGNNCAQIVAYTAVPYIVSLTKSLGANTDYTFISFDVDKSVQKLNGLKRGSYENNN